MTRDICSQACVQKGAKWSGIQDSMCYCGTNFDVGAGYFVPNDFCSITCKGNSSETCGSYTPKYALNTFNLNNYGYKAPSGSSGVGGYQGCFADGLKALSAYNFNDAKLTPEMCKSYCNQLGYSLAGTTSGNRCWCDNTFRGGQSLPDSQCNTPCSGNSAVTCGSTYNINLWYSNATTYGATQANAAHPAGWQGCYGATNIGSYSAYTSYPTTQSVSACKATCSGLGYSYASLWDNRCSCGTTLNTANRVADAFCNIKCKSSTEFCGGSQYLDVYAVQAAATTKPATTVSTTMPSSTSPAPTSSAPAATGYVAQGCVADGSTRALTGPSLSGNDMTIAKCATFAKTSNQKLFGLESGYQCFTGNALVYNTASTNCKTACYGDASKSTICGGSYALSLYSFSPATSVSSSPVLVVSTVSSSSTTKASSTTAAATTSAPASTGYVAKGCVADGSTRALNGPTLSGTDMTIAKCATFAKTSNKKLFGLESGYQCFTGDALVYNTASTNCKTACYGDASKTTICGGSYALSLYSY
jgi:hypothetical protein